MRIRFYRVSEWYTDELKKISPFGVTDNNKDHINTYVGILFEIDNIKYIAPLTHTSEKNKWHQQPIIITDKTGKVTNKLGTILFHNMIPVCDNLHDEVYEEVDVDDYRKSDPKRYDLYLEQLQWMNETENKKTIISKANQTYDIHLDSDHPDHSFLNNILHCKFKELEKKMNAMK